MVTNTETHARKSRRVSRGLREAGDKTANNQMTEKQYRDKVRAEHARTGKWPFQYSPEEIKEKFVANRSNLTPEQIESEWQDFKKEWAKRLNQRLKIYHAEMMSMKPALDELSEFNLFDELIVLLRNVAKEQNNVLHARSINFAAELLANISEKGYRPPRASVRKRQQVRKDVMFQWRVKGKYMTVEEFIFDINQMWSIPEGTVLKILYPKSKIPRRYKNLFKNVE